MIPNRRDFFKAIVGTSVALSVIPETKALPVRKSSYEPWLSRERRISDEEIREYIRNVLQKAMEKVRFEINDRQTRNVITISVQKDLDPLIQAREIRAYQVICDESNNPPLIIDSNTLITEVNYQHHYSLNEFTKIVGQIS